MITPSPNTQRKKQDFVSKMIKNISIRSLDKKMSCENHLE